MDDRQQVPQPHWSQLTSDAPDNKTEHNLISGPFAVIESDPGVFTTTVPTLGAQGLQVVELQDIEPWASDHLHPIYGLVFSNSTSPPLLHRKQKKPDGLDGRDDSTNLWFAK
jgi:ubiquitin carboxyl-terminal hydrolase L5